MATYKKGDVVTVWHVWKEADGTIKYKDRPGIVYDILGDDHYCILIYGKDRTGIIPGFTVSKDSSEGKQMSLTKDSFINLQKMVELQKKDIRRLIGTCPDEIIVRIQSIINDSNTEGVPPSD